MTSAAAVFALDQPFAQSPLAPQAALESCHLSRVLLVIIAKQV